MPEFFTPQSYQEENYARFVGVLIADNFYRNHIDRFGKLKDDLSVVDDFPVELSSFSWFKGAGLDLLQAEEISDDVRNQIQHERETENHNPESFPVGDYPKKEDFDLKVKSFLDNSMKPLQAKSFEDIIREALFEYGCEKQNREISSLAIHGASFEIIDCINQEFWKE